MHFSYWKAFLALIALAGCEGGQRTQGHDYSQVYDTYSCNQLNTELHFVQQRMTAPQPAYRGGSVLGAYAAGAARGQTDQANLQMLALQQAMVRKGCRVQ